MGATDHTLATKFANFERQFGAKPGDLLYVHATSLTWLSPQGTNRRCRFLVDSNMVLYAGVYSHRRLLYLESNDMLLVIKQTHDAPRVCDGATAAVLREIAEFGFTVITRTSFPELEALGEARNVVRTLKELPSLELCTAPA